MSTRGGHGGGRQGSKRDASSNHHAGESGGDAKRARLPNRPHTGAPTVRDLITDTLAPLANAYWAPGTGEHAAFDPQIIESIYSKHLAPSNEKTAARMQYEEERKGGQAEEDDELRRLQAEEEAEQTDLEHQRAQRLLLLELSAYLEKSVTRSAPGHA